MFPYFELTNIAMVYLLGATITGLRFGRIPAVAGAVANVGAFDFFFVPPRYTFAVTDVQYVVTFAVMLVVTLVIANLMASVRQQTRVAGARERRTALLYGMSRELVATRGISRLARVAVKHVAEVFECEAVVLLPRRERPPCSSGRAAHAGLISRARTSRSPSGWRTAGAAPASGRTRCRPRRRFTFRSETTGSASACWRSAFQPAPRPAP